MEGRVKTGRFRKWSGGLGVIAGPFASLVIVALAAVWAEATTTITLAQFKQRNRELEAQILRKFEERHPGIKVRLIEMPTSSDLQHQQFVTWLAARSSSVDVYAIDLIWAAEFAAAGWILPLDRFWPAGTRTAFFPRLIDAVSYAGRTYAVPRFTESGMLFYRKDLVPAPPRTWEELQQHSVTMAPRETSFLNSEGLVG